MTFVLPKHAQKFLSKENLEQKIHRMAYEILEIHYNVPEIMLLGIEGGGSDLAVLLAKKINEIHSIKITSASIVVKKEDPYSESPYIKGLGDRVYPSHIIVVDDVGNSGRTLFHALQPVYNLRPASLYVALLIDRTHKKFPIKADITGEDMATTLTEHIHVLFDENGEPEGAYVF